jgi:uncharacterized membrane protein YfcA
VSVGLGASLALIALCAFATEATIGFGATVLTVSLGAHLLPIDELLPAFVPVNMCLSAWLLLRNRGLVAWRRLASELAPPVAVGAVAGIALFHLPHRLALQLAFAIFVVLLAALELGRLARAASPTPSRRTGALLYAVGGLAHGLFGSGGPMIVYVLRRTLADKGAFRATLSVVWLTLNVALLGNFASMGLFTRATLETSLWFAAAVLPGLLIGQRLHHALDARLFHRVVLVVLLGAGSLLAVRTAAKLRDAPAQAIAVPPVGHLVARMDGPIEGQPERGVEVGHPARAHEDGLAIQQQEEQQEREEVLHHHDVGLPRRQPDVAIERRLHHHRRPLGDDQPQVAHREHRHALEAGAMVRAEQATAHRQR